MSRPMLAYSIPILLTSLGGMVNELADKILIKFLTPVPDAETLAKVLRKYAGQPDQSGKVVK